MAEIIIPGHGASPQPLTAVNPKKIWVPGMEAPKQLPKKEGRFRKNAKEIAKKMGRRSALNKRIDSFVLTEEEANPKLLDMLVELRGQDYIEKIKHSQRPFLTSEERSTLANQAIAMMDGTAPEELHKRGMKQRFFVATIKETHREGARIVTKDVPIAYMIYWFTPGGKLRSDRIFVSKRYREKRYGARIVWRCIGRAFMENPTLETMEIMDARRPYKTEGIVRELFERDFAKRYEIEEKNLVLYLNRDELAKEAMLIRTYDRWRTSRRIERIRRIGELRRLRRQDTKRWVSKKAAAKPGKETPKPRRAPRH
ncbi:MAG: hypothetical protein NT067_04165 [Candidatus Diapherotrites archaeon]|nr:hypothetical protein [Candidatus Diapherotrites archaeon]